VATQRVAASSARARGSPGNLCLNYVGGHSGDPTLIAVVDDDPRALAELVVALARRFGADYQVVSHAHPESALEGLALAHEGGQPIALVMASQALRTCCSAPGSTLRACPRSSCSINTSYWTRATPRSSTLR
jgi:hypothetical protein